MQTMDMSLAQHVKAGRITQQIAFERCHDPEELQRLVGGSSGGGYSNSDGYGAPMDSGFGSMTMGNCLRVVSVTLSSRITPQGMCS